MCDEDYNATTSSEDYGYDGYYMNALVGYMRTLSNLNISVTCVGRKNLKLANLKFRETLMEKGFSEL